MEEKYLSLSTRLIEFCDNDLLTAYILNYCHKFAVDFKNKVSFKELEKELYLKQDLIKQSLKKLEKWGYITITKAGKDLYNIRLNLDKYINDYKIFEDWLLHDRYREIERYNWKNEIKRRS